MVYISEDGSHHLEFILLKFWARKTQVYLVPLSSAPSQTPVVPATVLNTVSLSHPYILLLNLPNSCVLFTKETCVYKGVNLLGPHCEHKTQSLIGLCNLVEEGGPE